VLFLDEVSMVPSSSVVVAADGERLTCGGFYLGEPVHLGNFEFIANYFCGWSLSPRRGNDGTVFVVSTRSGASTPQRATIEDSPEEFLTMSSREGSFGYLCPRRCSTGAPLAPTTTATWKENTPATMMFLPWMVVLRPETNQPSEQHHAHNEGQPMQSCARHPHAKPELASQRSNLANGQTTTVVQPNVSPRHDPMLETESILRVDITST
jgi:hypothetical protein